MNAKRMGLWAAIGLLLAAGSAYGTLSAPQSLLDLEQNASLIVVGTATGTPQTGLTVTFSLQVSRVVKGDPALAGSGIAAYWAGENLGMRGAGATTTPAGTGIWFLRQSSTGWLLIPVTQGSLDLSQTFFPAPSGAVLGAYAYSPAASLSDRVASEIASAIEGAGGAHNRQLYALEGGMLDQLQSPVLGVFYRRMSASPLTQQRILGLSGLIRGGDAAALASAAQAASTLERYPNESAVLLGSIRDLFRPADPNSIAVLGQAAVDSTDTDLAFRQAAAFAVAAIHSTACLPYLAALLDNSDFDLRVDGVGGIASFANGLQAQTYEGTPSLAHLQLPASAPYKTADTIANFAMGARAVGKNEAALLAFWKNWWLQNRASLGY
jgi:hypothetical protein